MAAEPESWSAMAVVGRIARTHGRRGEVIVNLETDFPERRFRRDGIVYMTAAGDLRALRIEETRLQAGRPVIAVEGVAIAALDFRIARERHAVVPHKVFSG